MVRRRFYRSRTRRRPRRYRRRRRGVIRRRILRPLQAPTHVVKTKCVYGTSAALTSTSGSYWGVRISDFTDPFGSESTNQPLGYDQWKAIYNRGRVLGLKLTFTCHNSGSEPIVFGITRVPEDETVNTSPWEYRIEQTGTIYRLLSPDVDHQTISMNVSTKKYFKIANFKDCEEIAVDLPTDSAPERSGYLAAWAALHNGTTSTTIDIILKAEYIILLDKPVVPARSSG